MSLYSPASIPLDELPRDIADNSDEMSTVSSTSRYSGLTRLDVAEQIWKRSREAQEAYATAVCGQGRPNATEAERHKHWKSEIGRLAHDAPRLFDGIPPTVLAAKVCPHWWCQHGCTSMDMSIPEDIRPRCHWIHPAIIDYTMMNKLGQEFASDTKRTKDCIQIMPNVNRCHHFAYNGQCMHDEFDRVTGQQISWCRKGHASLKDTFDNFLNTHRHGANLLFETETGLFFHMEEVELVTLLEQDMQRSFWFYKPLTTDNYHDWKRLYLSRFDWHPEGITVKERDRHLQFFTVEDPDDKDLLDSKQKALYRLLQYHDIRSVKDEIDFLRHDRNVRKAEKANRRSQRSHSLPRTSSRASSSLGPTPQPQVYHAPAEYNPHLSDSASKVSVGTSSDATNSEVLWPGNEEIRPDDSVSNVGVNSQPPWPTRAPPKPRTTVPTLEAIHEAPLPVKARPTSSPFDMTKAATADIFDAQPTAPKAPPAAIKGRTADSRAPSPAMAINTKQVAAKAPPVPEYFSDARSHVTAYTAMSAPPTTRSVKAPPPTLDSSAEVVPFRIHERGQLFTLASRQYEDTNVAMVNVGVTNTVKAAERQVLVKSIVRSVTECWTPDTPDSQRCRVLKLLKEQWTRELQGSEPSLWPHCSSMFIAKFTALGVMVNELPHEMHAQFANSVIWSENGNILDTWFAVNRHMTRLGIHDIASRNIIDT